jgi:hypothetical protein
MLPPTTPPGPDTRDSAGWHVTVRDGAFHHETGGAPTAGPPPYDVYELRSTVAFGFGTDETFVPTRWRFPERPDRGNR